MDKFTNEKVRIGKTTFFFSKAPAMTAWRIFEQIRHAAATVDVGQIDPEKAGGSVESIGISALLKMPTEFVDSLREQMFNFVRFQTTTPDGKPQPIMDVAGVEDMAFQDLEPLHVYEVLARALAVNFTGSWSAILSRFPNAAAMVGSLSSPSTFPDTSQDPSQQD